MNVLIFLKNMVKVLLKSDENGESFVGLNLIIPSFLFKEAAFLDYS